MFKLLVIFFILCSQLIQRSLTAKSKPYTVLPFTLIKTTGGMKFPTNLEIRWTILMQKKIQFYHRNFLKQLVFCPADPHDTKLIEKANEIITEENPTLNRINSDCLFILKTFGQRFMSPYPRCAREPVPVITNIFRDPQDTPEEKTCGPNGTAKEYKFGYQLCFKYGFFGKIGSLVRRLVHKSKEFPLEDVINYSMYRFCYDKEIKRTIYTMHRISSPQLLSDPRIMDEWEKEYEMNTSSSGLFGSDFEELRNVYKKIESSPIPNVGKFVTQKLVPQEDFVFALWRKPTYHYANVQLIHETLVEFWDYINSFIRANAIKYNREFTIYTGTFTISPSSSNNIYIIEGTQIPEIWVKIIDYSYVERIRNIYTGKWLRLVRREGVAIIVNNYLNKEVMKQVDIFYCLENLCEEFAKKKFPEVYMQIRCCSVTKNLLELFGIELKFQKIFAIEGFIKVNVNMPVSIKSAN